MLRFPNLPTDVTKVVHGNCCRWRVGLLLVIFASCSRLWGADLLSVPDISFSPPAGGGGDSYMSFVTPDGHYVLFGSTANNLASNTNGSPYLLPHPQKINVFLRDRNQGTTALVSVDPSGRMSGDDDSIPKGISTNGQFALFESGADDLVPGTSGGPPFNNIFVRDLVNGITTLVNAGTNASSADATASDSVMTPDGRFVAFSSSADNLVPNDTNGISDVFVRDLQAGTTTIASPGAQRTVLPFGYGTTSSSDSPAITPDGRYVAFLSTATNLVPGVTNIGEIYVRDLTSNVTFCVSTNAHHFISGSIVSYNQRISDDGQTVTFATSAVLAPTTAMIFRHHLQSGVDDLVSSTVALPSGSYKDAQLLDMSADGRFVAFLGKTNSGTAVILWDGQTATNSVVSLDTNGVVPPSEFCEFPSIDLSGQYVSFLSTQTSLVTNSIASGSEHLYWRDLQAGMTKLVDVATNGTGPSRTFRGDYSFSVNGNFITFDSPDADLVANDNNQASDVFLRDLTADSTELISAHARSFASETSGLGGTVNRVSISADGRYAAFCATGSGLVPGYTNRYRGVFVRDLVNQSNFLVSVDTNGLADANGTSFQPIISGDGQHVAFTSSANNLVAHDTNGASDVFIRNLQTGVTTLVSANTNNTASMNGASSNLAISFDGRYVLYFNIAALVLRDCVVGTNYVLTTNANAAAMTPDGHYVAFFGVVNISVRLYVWDSQAAQRVYTNNPIFVSQVSISTNGQWLAYIVPVSSSSLLVSDRIANSNRTVSAGVFGPRAGLRFSSDGRYLAYATSAANVASDTNRSQDVYIYDWQTGSNSLVSQSFYFPQAAMGNSDSPDISADGRYIVYESAAPDIAPSDSNSVKDVFLYDRQANQTTLLSASALGQATANYESISPIFTGNGQTVAFQSGASDLIANDFNQGVDAFIVQINSTDPISGSTNPPPVFAGELIYSPSSGRNPTLTWPTFSGAGYLVQYKDELTDTNWQNVDGSIVIVGGQAAITDLAPNPTNRFYRILAY